MLNEQEINRAKKYVEQLKQLVHDKEAPNNYRTRAAGSCFAIAQDHHEAIVRLIEWQFFAAAFSLLRVEFEAYVRGEWFSQCASDSLINAYINGKEPPKIDCLLAELEMLESFEEGVLSKVKKDAWKSMCAYTHTGGLHIQRWNTEESIEPNYEREEVIQVVRFAEVFASWSVFGMSRIANNEQMGLQALELFKQRIENEF